MDVDKKLQQDLQLLSETVAIPEEYLRDAHIKIEKVFQLLQQNSRNHDVNRCKIVGGMGKKTSTWLKVDGDVVVFYNDKFGGIEKKDVLEEWEDILLLKTDLKEADIHRTKKLLSFTFEGVPIDLVAALNKVNMVNLGGQDVEKVQHLKEVAASFKTENKKDLTGSEYNLEWMQDQSKFVHDLARLAKFWSQTILFHKLVPGRSYLFEHLAVKAGRKTEEKQQQLQINHPSYIDGFKAFLEMVKGMGSLKVIFEDNYREADIPRDVRDQVPLLMDSVNQYNNLLDLRDDVKKDFLETFAQCARKTLERLERLRSSSIQQFEKNALALFMPQPLFFEYPFKREVLAPAMNSFMVGIEKGCLLIPKKEIRRDGLSSNQKNFVDRLLSQFAAVLGPTTTDNPHQQQPTPTQIKEKAEAFVDQMMNTGSRNWTPSVDGHESRQCTLNVPVENGQIARVSFDFDKTNN